MVLPPNFVFRKHRGAALWFDPAVNDPMFLDTLADADRLFRIPNCQIVKDQRKIKVARVRLNIAGEEHVLYVKRYNSFSLRFKIFSPFFSSGALRSLSGAAILEKVQVAAARPVAAVEGRSWGILLNSFFISEEIVGGRTADVYWLEHLRSQVGLAGFRCRREFIRRLAELFRSLHAARVYHNDLKDANILAVQRDGRAGCSLFLLDLEGVRRCRQLSDRRRMKNLVQLYRTLGRLLSRSQQMTFLKSYLGPRFAGRRQRRVWTIGVLQRAREIDQAKGREIARAVF